MTCIHQLLKNGKNTTRTIPFLVREVQGISGLALANVDPRKHAWQTQTVKVDIKRKSISSYSFPLKSRLLLKCNHGLNLGVYFPLQKSDFHIIEDEDAKLLPELHHFRLQIWLHVPPLNKIFMRIIQKNVHANGWRDI